MKVYYVFEKMNNSSVKKIQIVETKILFHKIDPIN